jgi:hypothetical protein
MVDDVSVPSASDAPSTSFSLATEDWQKVGKGAVIAILGAVLTYGTSLIPTVNFGNYTPLAVALWSVLVNLGWKYVKNNQK